MDERTKRILGVVAFLAATVVLGYLLYVVFLKQPVTVTPLPNANEQFPGGLPTAGVNTNQAGVNEPGQMLNINGQLVPANQVDTTPPSGVDTVARGSITKVTTVAPAQIQSLQISSDGRGVLGYNPTDGKFYRYQNGGTVALSDATFPNVKSLTWAPSGDAVVLKFPDNATILYDFKTKKQTTLPSHWQEFSFSADSKQLAFKSMALDRENRWLSVANSEGSQVQTIAPVGDNSANISVLWSPNKQVVGNYRESIDFDRSDLIFITTNGTELPSTIIEGRGFSGKYSPDGQYLFYSVYSSFTDMKPNLWVVTANGEQSGLVRVNLNLQTWSEKCAFADTQTVYCAVPRTLPRGAGLVPAVADSTPDDFYKIDLRNGSKTLIAVPDGQYTATDVTIGSDGRTLYFTDKQTSQPQQLQLR